MKTCAVQNNKKNEQKDLVFNPYGQSFSNI